MTKTGVKALLIVIGTIILLSAIGFIISKGAELAKRRTSLPNIQVLPTIGKVSPAISPTGVVKIVKPTDILIPAVKGATSSALQIEVNISGFTFQPKSITARRGSTIVWKNNDKVNHTITASDSSFASGSIVPGDSFKQKFDKIKSYSYYCSFHPEMKGVITIQ